MAKIQTAEQYRDLLTASDLLSKEKLAEAISAWARAGAPEAAEAMSKIVVDGGFLTEWQSSHLLAGRSQGFFLGRYVLMSPIGKGGMGRVYLARHLHMKRQVAIKILDAVSDDMRERFLRESQVVAALDHPNIVRAHDYDCDERVPYLVMEYVEGRDLMGLVQELGPLTYIEAAEYIRQAADGLHHAHVKGVVHRDVKPGNLLLREKTGVVKVLDLGLALMREGGDEESSEDVIIGTADYLAPEQVMRSNVDARADVYGLGGTLYFLLVGHPPFPEGTIGERMMKHQTSEPESILNTRPDCPPELIAIFQKMMAKQPEDRFQTCKELAEVLSNWIDEYQGLPSESDVHMTAPPGTQEDTLAVAAAETQLLKPLPTDSNEPGVACELCGKQYQYDPELDGQQIECSYCANRLTMARPEAAAAEQIACPKCGQSYPLTPALRGRKVQCTACGDSFQVPAAGDSSKDVASKLLAPLEEEKKTAQKTAEPKPATPVEPAIVCTHCQAQFPFDARLQGRKVQCRSCGQAFVVPLPELEAPPPQSATLSDFFDSELPGDLPAPPPPKKKKSGWFGS